MIEFQGKIWRGLAAIAAGAALSSCGPAGEAGEGGRPDQGAAAPIGEGGEASEAGVNAPANAPVGEGGEGDPFGEGGEAGIGPAYALVPDEAQTAMIAQHLKGFYLIGREYARAERIDEAVILVEQGLLEVYRPGRAALTAAAGDVDLTLLEMALNQNGALGLELAAAIAAIDQIRGNAGGARPEILRGMLGIANALYKLAVTAEGVDPIEYQHSLGAALAAKDAYDALRAGFNAQDPARAARLDNDFAAFLALWPQIDAPETPSLPADIAAAISRIELSMSGFR